MCKGGGMFRYWYIWSHFCHKHTFIAIVAWVFLRANIQCLQFYSGEICLWIWEFNIFF